MRILLIYLEPLDNEPMGLLYIGTVLEKAGHSIKISGIERTNPEQKILKEIYNFKPQVVGLSITSVLTNKAQRIAGIIKQNFPKIVIIAGGPHPTILPEETLKNKNIDICVIGEGELTVVALLEAIANQKKLEGVTGIAFLKEENIFFSKERQFIDNLDELPFVNRELLPKEVIYGRAGYPVGNPCMFVFTTRGCPFKCSFCQPTVNKIFGDKVRRRSPENVIQEIIELKKRYKVHGLWINDDTLLIERNWIEKFCDYLVRERLDILWYANGRFNIIDEGILVKMRDAGCAGLVMTPETGSQRIRNEILNKNVSDEMIIKAYELCEKVGIPFQANIILASPEETEEELGLSLKLIKRIQPHFMNCSYATALPETFLHFRYAREILASEYYKKFEDYDIGKFKKINCVIPERRLREVWNFFEKKYSNTSFSNRARHFWHYPYFRKILYRRWKSLIISRHPKFRHFVFDIFSIIIGSFLYWKDYKIYEHDLSFCKVKN